MIEKESKIKFWRFTKIDNEYFLNCCSCNGLIHSHHLVHWSAFKGGYVSTVTSPCANVTQDSR